MTKRFADTSPFVSIALMACSLCLLLPYSLSAQSQIQIIGADSLSGETINGEAVTKLIGNAHLRSKQIEIYADRVLKFTNQEKVQAFGNIEIDTGEEIIWADSLTYYTDIDFSELRGRVIIKSDSTTLFGNSVDYRFTNKVAHFLDKIRLEDERGTLVANSGFYFRQADSATFRGQVQLRDSLKYIEGDSLFSNRSRGYYELHGNVYAYDPENDSMLKGDYLEADSTGRRLLKGNAWLKNFNTPDSTAPKESPGSVPAPDSLDIPPVTLRPSTSNPDNDINSQTDTTHIRAARILSLQHRTPTDTTTTIKSYENVRIWSPDFAAVSDSARYQSQTQIFELWSDAKTWHQQIQLSGPYIWVQLNNGDIEQLVSYPNPFIVQQDTGINRLNQIKGDTLNALFTNGDIRLMRVYQNSHLLRFTEQNGSPDGALELTAPVTNIYFEKGELTELKSLGNSGAVSGFYLPESEQTAGKKLDGFTWNPDLRPHRPDQQMQRRFPPIPESPPFKLPRRYVEYLSREIPSVPSGSREAPTDSLRQDGN